MTELYEATKDSVVVFRRVTVPLDGSSSSATLQPLMKDDSYIFSELPRVNPHYKVHCSSNPRPDTSCIYTSRLCTSRHC